MKTPEQFELELKRRYARWSPAAWAELLDTALPPFLKALESHSEDEAEKILTAYLNLCGEGIGLGKLHPGAANLYDLLFVRLIPAKISELSAASSKIARMAELWNLCEAVESQQAWVESILHRRIAVVSSLSEIDPIVDRFSEVLNQLPDIALSSLKDSDIELRICSTESFGYFLPRRLEFTAAPVLRIVGDTPQAGLALTYFLPEAQWLASEVIGEAPHSSGTTTDVWVADKVSRLPYRLTPQQFISNDLMAAAIFQESQSVWLWTRKS